MLDEALHIDATLDALLAQDYDGPLEVIVADGGSTDGTLIRLEERAGVDPRLFVVDNPERLQSPGLNRAARRASGEFLVRADGHSTYAQDYVRNSIRTLLETDAVAAGGPMNPVCHDGFGCAVAAAMNSRMALPARFHHARKREEVDTVYLGAFRRRDFLELGGFRSFPSGTAEDADLYARWRAAGRTVLVDPSIRSEYQPRSTARALWKQYWRYGRGKSEMLWVNRRLPSPRPLAPALLILGLGAFLVVALASSVWWPLAALAAMWLTWLAAAGLRSDALAIGVMAAIAIMHQAYGLGLIWGLVRGPAPVRRALER